MRLLNDEAFDLQCRFVLLVRFYGQRDIPINVFEMNPNRLIPYLCYFPMQKIDETYRTHSKTYAERIARHADAERVHLELSGEVEAYAMGRNSPE